MKYHIELTPRSEFKPEVILTLADLYNHKWSKFISLRFVEDANQTVTPGPSWSSVFLPLVIR